MVDVPVVGTIRLGQFLKLAGVVAVGSDARRLLADGSVSVNGEQETRRGRTLVPGDLVRVGRAAARVAASAPTPGDSSGGPSGRGPTRGERA
ncbi:MAG: RNA-binding S4 domain-containing protein [Actinomycetota bacterium]|nr:RNA-binding S4 domain-containing protein [Actinomycetota bacterium]